MTNTSGCGGGTSAEQVSSNPTEGHVTIQKVMEHHTSASGENITDGQVWHYRLALGNIAANGMVWSHRRTVDMHAQNMTSGESAHLSELALEDEFNLQETTGVRDALAHVLGHHLPESWLVTKEQEISVPTDLATSVADELISA